MLTMKTIEIADRRPPYPKKARALLSLFCQELKQEELPGFSLTPSQVECRYKLDGQNNRLAREVAYYILSGGSRVSDSNLDAYDVLVCELFALDFTYYDLNRTMPNRTIAALESGAGWSDFDTQLDKRLGLRTAADVQVSLLREYFLDHLGKEEAA
jgi:hypothetical protein